MDVYRDSFFLQSGSLDLSQHTVTKEFGDGSILFILSSNNSFLDHIVSKLEPFLHGDSPFYLESFIGNLITESEKQPENGRLLFFYIGREGIIEFIAQNMPPFLLKKKNDDVSLIENNFSLFTTSSIGKAISRLSMEEVAVMVMVDNKKIMTELKNRFFSIFAKCELEKMIRSMSNRGSELDFSYVLLNNTLRDRIKFSHSERVPAKIEKIIAFEKELERILKDSYPKHEGTNDHALTVFNELMLNAYEHGSLDVGSDTKQALMIEGSYEEHLDTLEKTNDAVIDVEIVIYEQSLLKISLRDYGRGFDYEEFNCKEKNISETLLHGRGVQMANQMSATAYYEDGGRKVSFFIKYEREKRVNTFHHSDETMLQDMSLLYVEDDEFIMAQFSKIIKRMVGELYTAKNGVEGLDVYRMEHPDIVLTDIEMPKMNGLDMAEKIKEINQDQSILIMTAYNQDDKFLRAIDIGVDKYVIKPVKIDQLKNALYTTAKQIFFKKEAIRLLKEKEQRDMEILSDLQSKNRYSIAQQNAAFKKQELIIHDDSIKYENAFCKVFYKPLELLSGDIYGVYKIDEANTLLYIIDSMGKGLAASVTAVLSAAYINRSLDKSVTMGNFEFDKLIDDYQDYIKKYVLDDECISFMMVNLNLEKRTFQHSSFGMYPILVKDCQTGEITQYKANNAPFNKYLPVRPISEEFSLPEQFGLFAFSDGLVETEDFGMKELLYHLEHGQEDEEIMLFRKIMDKNFIADDDLTLIHFSSGCRRSGN